MVGTTAIEAAAMPMAGNTAIEAIVASIIVMIAITGRTVRIGIGTTIITGIGGRV
jgi:hypothetical protein